MTGAGQMTRQTQNSVSKPDTQLFAIGTVINGKTVGRRATRGGPDDSFALTEAQDDVLLAAMAEIHRGEVVTLEDLLQSLRLSCAQQVS